MVGNRPSARYGVAVHGFIIQSHLGPAFLSPCGTRERLPPDGLAFLSCALAQTGQMQHVLIGKICFGKRCHPSSFQLPDAHAALLLARALAGPGGYPYSVLGTPYSVQAKSENIYSIIVACMVGGQAGWGPG